MTAEVWCLLFNDKKELLRAPHTWDFGCSSYHLSFFRCASSEFCGGRQKHPVLNGPPIDCHAEPIGLYHPVFNDFQDAMANPEPLCYNAATYSAVRSSFDVSSRIYDDEKERVQTIQGHLQTLLGRRLGVVVEKGVISDGVISTSCHDESTAYLLIQEVKNEIGTGHSDPYN